MGGADPLAPDRDVIIIPDTPSFYRDPHKDHWGRMGIDATVPFSRRQRIRAQEDPRRRHRRSRPTISARVEDRTRSKPGPGKMEHEKQSDRRACGDSRQPVCLTTRHGPRPGVRSAEEDHASSPITSSTAVTRRSSSAWRRASTRTPASTSTSRRRRAAASSSRRSTAGKADYGMADTSSVVQGGRRRAPRCKGFMVFTDVTTNGLAVASALSDA